VDVENARQASAQRIAAVIVTYEPDAGFPQRVLRAAGQVGRVIIVDNSRRESARRRLRGCDLGTVELIENGDNEGLARALNQGLRRAVQLECAWALTLDQDSEIDPELVQALVALYDRCPFRERVGLIGANARSKHSGTRAVRCKGPQRDFIEVKTTITSGSLMALSAYQVAGPLRDDFFIEGVDLEYCLRLRKFGFRILLSCEPRMTHAAGNMEERRLAGRTIVVANHAPWRYYYATRNLLKIARTYFWREPTWVVAALANLGKATVKMLLYEERRAEKVTRMIMGAWDAATGSERLRFLPHPP
jgi:rhamnosyltransferase